MANTFGEETAKELIHAIQNYPETISVRLNFNRLLQGKLYPTYFDAMNIVRFTRTAKNPSVDDMVAQYGDAWLRQRMVQSALLSAPHTFLSLLKRAASASTASLPSHTDDASVPDTIASTGKVKLSKTEQQALLKERKRLKQEKHLAKRRKDTMTPEALSTRSAHLPTVPPSHLVPASLTEPIPWYPHAGRYLALRPAFNCDPAYHLSGAYYSQDAASQLVVSAVSAGHTEGLDTPTLTATAAHAGGVWPTGAGNPATAHAGLTFTATDAEQLFSGRFAAASFCSSPHTAPGSAGVNVLPHTGLSQRPLRVLDLCAAPGGKGTLLRQWLHEDSLLISNEIDSRRAQALLENVHKQGSGRGADALVISCSLEDLLARGDMRAVMGLSATDVAGTCDESADGSTARPAADGVWEYPQASTGWTAYDRATQQDTQAPLSLSAPEPVGFEGFFDVVLIDAPCSGSAMFRKARAPLENWSTSLVDSVTDTQRRLIDGSLRLLRRPGGLLVYMTCSFDEAENARHIAWVHSHRADPAPTRKAGGVDSPLSSADAAADRCFPAPAPLRAVEAAAQAWGLRAETLPTHRGSGASEDEGVHAREEGHVMFTGLPSAARLEGCFAAGLVMATPQTQHAPASASEHSRSHFLPPARAAAADARAPAYNEAVADLLASTTGAVATAAPSATAATSPPSIVIISVADTHALGQYYIAAPSMEAALAATWLAPSAIDKYALLLEFKPQLPHADAEESAAQGRAVDFRVECHLFPRAHLPVLQWLGPVRADTAFRELGGNNPQRRAGYALDPRVDAHVSPQGGKAHLSRPSILAAGHHAGTLALTLEPKHAQYLLTRLQRNRAHTPLATASKVRNIKLKTENLAFVPSQQLALESPTLLHPRLRSQPLVSLTRAEAMSFAAQPQAMRAWSSLSMQVAAVVALRWAFTRYAAGEVAKVLQLCGSTRVAGDVMAQSSIGDGAIDSDPTPAPSYTTATVLSCRRLLSSLRLLAAVEQEALWQLALGAAPTGAASVTDSGTGASNRGYAALLSAAVARAEHEQLLQPLGADILGLYSHALADAASPTTHSAAASNDVLAIARACVDDIAQSQWGVDVVAVRAAAAALEDQLATVLLGAGQPTTSESTGVETPSSSIASWLRSPEAVAALRPAIDAVGVHLSKEARSAAAAVDVDANADAILSTLSTLLPAEDTNACRRLLAQTPSAALWVLLAHPDTALSSAGEAVMPSAMEQANGLYGPLERAMLQALQSDGSSLELASGRQSGDAEAHTGTSHLAGTAVGGGAAPYALFTPLLTPPLLHVVSSAVTGTLAAPALHIGKQTAPSPWARALLRAAGARPMLSLAALHSVRAAEGTLALATCDGLPVGWLQRQCGKWVSLAPRSWRIARYQAGEVLLDMLAFGEAQARTDLDCSVNDVHDGENELVNSHDQERDEDGF